MYGPKQLFYLQNCCETAFALLIQNTFFLKYHGTSDIKMDNEWTILGSDIRICS